MYLKCISNDELDTDLTKHVTCMIPYGGMRMCIVCREGRDQVCTACHTSMTRVTAGDRGQDQPRTGRFSTATAPHRILRDPSMLQPIQSPLGVPQRWFSYYLPLHVYVSSFLSAAHGERPRSVARSNQLRILVGCVGLELACRATDCRADRQNRGMSAEVCLIVSYALAIAAGYSRMRLPRTSGPRSPNRSHKTSGWPDSTRSMHHRYSAAAWAA